nr:MAG TPA: hypothetical protein [Caudoviricetes sp.]
MNRHLYCDIFTLEVVFVSKKLSKPIVTLERKKNIKPHDNAKRKPLVPVQKPNKKGG